LAEVPSVSEPGVFRMAKPPVGLLMLLGALTAIPPLSIDLYLASLPAIAKSYGAPPGAAQITIASFLAGLAVGQMIYGPASDRWGRRGSMLAGAALYLVGSVACALAPSLTLLIVARFVQALGGCAGAVIGRAVVRDRFDHRNSARVLSMLMLVSGLAPIIAPIMGSLLARFVAWRVLFWIMSVFAALLLVWAFFGLEESRSSETAAHARSEHPFRAYLALLRSRTLMGFTLAQGLNAAALFAYISAAPGLLIAFYGVPTFPNFGLIFCLNGCGLIGMSQVNARLLRYYTPEQIIAGARPVTVACAVALAGAALTGVGGIWGVLVPLFFVVGSFGFFGANAIASGLNVDPRRAGSISALMGTATFSIGAAASAMVSAFRDIGPRPMALTILLSIVLSAVALYTMALPRGRRMG
jgi:DHA1 family bicyclomycin/chloramphenicol resistance-like MFS transporter